MRNNITDRWVRSIKPDAERQLDFWDKDLPCFSLRVSPRGRKTWTVYYRFHKRKRRFTLGTYPSVSVSEARSRARAAIAQVSAGIDPAAQKIAAQRAGTFKELTTEYIERHAKPRKKSWLDDRWMIDRHLLPKWEHIKARDITRADVRALVEAIADRGTGILANRVLALISKVFSVAVDRDWRADNPCKGIERPGKERPRTRVLSTDEIKAIWEALENEDPFIRALFQLRFLTAARGGELRSMRWADVDLASRMWIIPEEHSKNRVAHHVPLTDTAHQLLTKLRAWQDDRRVEINAGRTKKGWPPRERSVWVFPSPKGDTQFMWEQRITRRLKTTTGIDFRPHDIRRTVATFLTQNRLADRFLLKKLLNHVDRDITGVYDRNHYGPEKRRALEGWGTELKRILSDAEETAAVLRFTPAV